MCKAFAIEAGVYPAHEGEGMAPFTRMQTQMVEKSYLMQALADLGYTCEEGLVEIRGYSGNRRRVEIKVTTKNPGYDIGFRNAGNTYEIIADWWGIRDTNEQTRRQRWSVVPSAGRHHLRRAGPGGGRTGTGGRSWWTPRPRCGGRARRRRPASR